MSGSRDAARARSVTAVVLQQVVNGVTIGVVYALIAIGLTLVFGILGVINFAHGDFYMIGAFLTYTLTVRLGLEYFLALALTIAGGAAVGLLAERLAVRPLKDRHMFTVVLSTLGLSIFLENGALLVWGPDPREIELAWGSRPLLIGGVVITFLRLAVLATAAALIVALTWFIRRTTWGMAMRAVAANRDAAALMGIPVDRVYAITFAVGSALAGVAGGLLGAMFTIEPTMGEWAVVKAFSVVIMGGMGHVPGAVLGGIILGVAESLGAGFLPGGTSYKDGIGYAILILVLLYRPQGLFGRGA
ncbi:MAG: branched-chain amino acid ABC transporter permease [Candidatus Rokuibacteriota bacterium]|nr:MAG: branched-chain amino acid ABC transporter permease [Candidatus Rokubacteria bacterium]